MKLRRSLWLVRFCACLLFLLAGVSSSKSVANEDSVSIINDAEMGQLLDAPQGLDSTVVSCQRFNYEYRQCVAVGCLFDGRTGICYGPGNPGPGPMPPPPNPRPEYCSRFNYDQYQCNRAGCYFDHRSGVCFDGGNYPPNPPGYRFTCVAVDDGYEEHSRGHMGIGHSRYTAEQAAMGDCLRFHGQCRIRECRQQ